ncbi:hypothetical protein [Leptolyngbya sp. GGD]|uniref:hypothetical protein n=1 Tax=Leptolyngbya sp. GGD TaxID=2997907 RepID=UPI00227B8A35|nr:hypothetical protein [Leptolyngbya sp. GGD]MCY6491905.1 hypothetical protein [Leptolyngbya sp. GGD]
MARLHRLLVRANFALFACRLIFLPVLAQSEVITPDQAADLQHKAQVVQTVLKPIERLTKPDDDDKKKPRK